MAMTTDEMFPFYEEQIRDSESFLKEGLDKRDYNMAQLNLAGLFRECLTLGLLYWRRGVDPTRYLAMAVTSIVDGIQALNEIDPLRSPNAGIPIDASLYLASLLEMQHPPVDLSALNPHQVSEAFLGSVLMGYSKIEDWTKYSSVLSPNKRHSLFIETMDNYARMLKQDGDLHQRVRIAESLYARRKDDSYYSGGPISEGGGGSNSLVVDFRLAAILKKIGSDVPTIHAWKW